MTYLDHAATTPLLPEVVAALTAELAETGNPSSLHASGRAARKRVEEARESVARSLGARPSEVVFTSGGTEADNLAVKGIFWARQAEDPRRRRVLVSGVEHHAVLDPAQWLVDTGAADLEVLPVDRHGRVSPETVAEAVSHDPESVALVSVMWANNEVGTVSPVPDIAAVAHRYGIPVHSDAVQAVGALDVDFAASGLDAMTVTGHKLGGPVGVGALVLGRHLAPVPVLHGGGQERDVRSGTVDTAGIVAFAEALRLAVTHRTARRRELAALRDRLQRELLEAVPDLVVNGDPDPAGRLPGLLHVSVPGCEGDALLMLLDARGVEVSTGSACSAGVPRPSHVLLAMGLPEGLARSSLRLSLGWSSTGADVDAAVAALPPAVERARRAGLVSARG